MPLHHISLIWPYVRGHVEKALKRDDTGRYLPVDVLNELLAERAKLWIVWNSETKTADAAVITDIIEYPRSKELRIRLIGGRNMKAWAKESLRVVEDYARAQGCEFVAGFMRRGWLRVGGPEYRETGITMLKRL